MLLFPMEVMTISQGVNDPFSHAGTMNIDLAGKDSGSDPIFAPADITVKWFGGDSNGIIVWTNEPVLFADGTVNYASIRILHDNDISNLRVGQVYKQGDIFYQEGTAGWATGNHIHFNVAKGRTTEMVKHSEVPNGYSDLKGSVHPASALFINNTTIKKNIGYDWKTYVVPEYAPMKDVENTAFNAGPDNIWMRAKPSTNYPTVGKLLAGAQVPVSQVSTAECNGYSWVKINYNGVDGYCAVVSGSEVFVVLTPVQILEAKLAAANAKIAAQEEIIKKQQEVSSALSAEIASFVVVEQPVYFKGGTTK